MAEVAARVAEIGARPGLWFRPLLSRTETGAVRPGVLRDSGFPLDPSLDVALDAIAEDMTRFRNWGYSGTALFVSVDPAVRTDRTDGDLVAAVRLALDGGTPGGVEPLGRLSTTAPRRWRCGPETLVHDWAEPWGATPLAV